MPTKIIIILICVTKLISPLSLSVPTQDDIIGKAEDLITAGVHMNMAMGNKVADLVPSPDELIGMSKEVLFGLPMEIGMRAVKQFCSVALSGHYGQSRISPDFQKLNFILFTKNSTTRIPVTSPEQLLSFPYFNPNCPIVIMITGFLTDMTYQYDMAIDAVWKGYRARGNVNFLALDSARLLDTLYSWSAFNTEEIGQYVGQALAKLVDVYPVANIHVIGHSLGAQVAGASGRYFTSFTNKTLPRITGLDPANPCFGEGEMLTGLFRGDADFVDVIHTNNGVYGQKEPIGDVDFYPNGVAVLQSGCVSTVCAHLRSWQFYAESLYPGNEHNFLATRCNSLVNVRAKICKGKRIPMGYAAPRNAKGNFFLSTSASKPFGEDAKQ